MILYDRPWTPQRLVQQQRRRYVYQNRHHKIHFTTTCQRTYTIQDPNYHTAIVLSLMLHHFMNVILRLFRIMSRISRMVNPSLLLLLTLLLPLHIHHRLLHHHYIHGVQAFHPHHCGISSMKRYHSRPRPRHAVSFASLSIFESTDTTVTTVRTTTPIPPPTVSYHHHNDMIMIIDVENVRGFNGFRYTHSQLLQLLQVYLVGQPVPPSLLLVMDHGNLPSSYYVPPPQQEPHSNGYAIVFAGPHCKADDTIVHDVIPYLWTTLLPLLSSSPHNDHPEDKPSHPPPRIKVVTADRMLISRCHRAVREFYKSRNTLPPPTTGARSNHKKKKYEMEVSDSRYPNIRLEIVNPNLLWTELIRLPAPWNEVETNVTDNENVNNTWTPNHVSARRRKHRTSRIYVQKETTEDRIILAERLRLTLEEQQQEQDDDDSINQNTIDSNEGTSTTSSISPAHAYVIHKHRNHHRSATAQSSTTTPTFATTAVPLSTAPDTEEVESILTHVPPPTVESQPARLRLVVVSDTHGFEDQLTGPLPDGDVLLHLGDFAMDTIVTNTAGGHKSRRNRHDHSQLKNFDVWLAQQSARTKIVVRGNHDPRSMAFVKSGAMYVTQPTMMDIGGYKFAFVPYQSATKNGLRHKGTIPKTGCDVIVSHVPPYSILDRCHTGKLAGSNTLLKGAQSINGKDGPPILWLCGHIHESRGIVHDIVLCKSKSKDAATTTKIATDIGTTIVNAACANLGRANYIEYGPTVLDLCRNIEFPNTKLDGRDDDISDSSSNSNNKLKKQVNLVHMDGRYEFMNSKFPYFFRCEGSNDVADSGSSSISNMLLAIDLGLRTGVSLFDRANSGRLVRYDHFDYDTAASLEVGAVQLLQDWEIEMNTFQGNSLISSNKIVRRITHIAIEGSDPPLIEAWKRAILQISSNNKVENIKQSKNVETTVDRDDRSSATVSAPVRKLLLVSPNEWRTDLLTRAERSSGESAKLASRRMAQCIIHEHDSKNNAHHQSAQNNIDAASTSLSCLEPPPALDLTAHSSTNSADHILSTDVAESILMGYHITRRLGWCTL